MERKGRGTGHVRVRWRRARRRGRETYLVLFNIYLKALIYLI